MLQYSIISIIYYDTSELCSTCSCMVEFDVTINMNKQPHAYPDNLNLEIKFEQLWQNRLILCKQLHIISVIGQVCFFLHKTFSTFSKYSDSFNLLSDLICFSWDWKSWQICMEKKICIFGQTINSSLVWQCHSWPLLTSLSTMQLCMCVDASVGGVSRYDGTTSSINNYLAWQDKWLWCTYLKKCVNIYIYIQKREDSRVYQQAPQSKHLMHSLTLILTYLKLQKQEIQEESWNWRFYQSFCYIQHTWKQTRVRPPSNVVSRSSAGNNYLLCLGSIPQLEP